MDVNIFHEYLDDVRLVIDHRAFAASLQSKYAQALRPDVIVAVGVAAVRLLRDHRPAIFRSVPVVFMQVDENFLSVKDLSSTFTGVTFRPDYRGTVELARKLHPNARHCYVVAGVSPGEKAYLQKFREYAAPLLEGLTVTYLGHESLGEILATLNRAPADSIVIYLMMFVDASQVVYAANEISDVVAAASAAPVYSPFVTYFKGGIVGGSFFDADKDAKRAAAILLRVLHGEPASKIPRLRGTDFTAVDWRQLDRWHIPETRIGASAAVHFRGPSVWARYRRPIAYVAIALSVLLLLVVFLVRDIRRRIAYQSSLKALSSKLISAQEEERRRLARDLHDDIGQRIASMNIAWGALKHNLHSNDNGALEEIVRQQKSLSELADATRQISHHLHPAILTICGLEQALSKYCREFGSSRSISIQFSCDVPTDDLASDVALCLYRIAQEALQNVIKHSGAPAARVSLTEYRRGYLLTIADNGRGFNRSAATSDRGLGLVAMEERLQALGGTLTITSKQNHGATVSAWVSSNDGTIGGRLEGERQVGLGTQLG